MNLKDYSELKAHFNETKQILLLRNKKESIEELESTRRNQIKFINYIIDDFDRKIRDNLDSKKAAKPQFKNVLPDEALIKEATSTLYGAMSLISTIITKELNTAVSNTITTLTAGTLERNSMLRDRLDLAMGISEAEKPANHQYNKFYKKLNQYFKRIFIDEDSRKGINPEHHLQYIHTDSLISFIRKSYKEEELYHNKALEDLEIESNPTEAGSYKTNKADKLQSHILDSFVSWGELKSDFDQLIIAELGRKNVADISMLNKDRALQLGFLKTLEKTLTEIPTVGIKEPEKIAIFAGAMHIVKEQISIEYSNNTLSRDESRSLIHSGLTEILKDSKNPEDIEALVQATHHYIKFMTTGSHKIRINHMFSEIHDFSLTAILELSAKIIKNCRITALEAAYNKSLVEEDGAHVEKKSGGYSFTGLLGIFLPAGKARTASSDQTEKKAAVTAKDSATQENTASSPR
jgi:hypothetical protein